MADDIATPALSGAGPAAVPGAIPGDRAVDTAAMLRVDQAGEFGARRIYAGQLAVMGNRTPTARVIARMAAQEERHSRIFDQMVGERRVRPTLLEPVWTVAGFALGAATALMGPRAAMACTAAVETEIDRHYAQQLDELGAQDSELATRIADFQADEQEHRATAIEHQAEAAPGYPLLSAAIRLGCRVAIGLSRRI